MAAAYATIANDGVYIQPTFYTKITTHNGTEVLKITQNTKRAFPQSVAYVTKQLLTEPVNGSNGTATYCKVTGMDVAAKTGTTNEDYDRWLCGFTNYYTAVTWFGFDMSETIQYNSKNPAGLIWSNVMNSVHKELKNSKFEMANGVVSKEICKKSQKVANTGCKDKYTEYFVRGTVPESCTTHQGTTLKDVVDDDTKQKIKDVVKDTVDSVKDEINGKPELPTPTTAPIPAPTTPTDTMPPEEQPIVTPNNEPVQEESEPQNTISEDNTNQATDDLPKEDEVVDDVQNIENEDENEI